MCCNVESNFGRLVPTEGSLSEANARVGLRLRLSDNQVIKARWR